jgi:hypothetical protein
MKTFYCNNYKIQKYRQYSNTNSGKKLVLILPLVSIAQPGAALFIYGAESEKKSGKSVENTIQQRGLP